MFVRTLLAISLSSFFVNSLHAAQSLEEQPLQVQRPDVPVPTKKVTTSPPPATTSPLAAATEAEISKKVTSQSTTSTTTKKTNEMLQKPVQRTAKPSTSTTTKATTAATTATAAATTSQAIADAKAAATPAKPATPPNPNEPLTLASLNNAEWSPNLSGSALRAFTAKAQVLLDNAYTTPGAIDGSPGNKMSKAIRAFQTIHGLSKTNEMNQVTWNKLVALQGGQPAFKEYTISADDVNKNKFVASIPASYEEKAALSGLKYTRVTELLGEKFHMDEGFLKLLNPKAKFTAGEKIIVANVNGKLPEDIHLIIAMKDMKQVYLYNSKNKMVGSFPATVGKETTPSPSGTLKITGIARNPWYTKPGEKKSLPAGPNTPVGNVWIALSKPSYGIHGTPEPSKISNDGQGSAGCVRLTNWDANRLANSVKKGVTVIFRDDVTR